MSYNKLLSPMNRGWPCLVTAVAFAASAALAQSPAVSTDPTATPAMSQDQMRELIRHAAEKDIENDKAQRDYTYIQREEERKLNGKGDLQSTEIRTYEVMMLFGEQVRKQISKNDQPLPPKDAAKEEEKIQKIIDKRKEESDNDRKKRLEKEEKNREDNRQFVKEIADAYNFRFKGEETMAGHETYVIDGDPRPGYEPHMKDAKFLPKFRFTVWIDKAESQWVKIDVRCIDTVSVGLFLVRLHEGSNIQIEQVRVNDEVWLPKHVALKLDARVALFKGVNIEEDATYSDYRKFRTDTKITPAGEVEEPEEKPR